MLTFPGSLKICCKRVFAANDMSATPLLADADFDGVGHRIGLSSILLPKVLARCLFGVDIVADLGMRAAYIAGLLLPSN